MMLRYFTLYDKCYFKCNVWHITLYYNFLLTFEFSHLIHAILNFACYIVFFYAVLWISFPSNTVLRFHCIPYFLRIILIYYLLVISCMISMTG